MIRKAIFAAAALLATLSLAPSTAIAANLTVKDGAGATQALCARTQTDGSLAECHVILDTTNTQIDPATKQLQQSQLTTLGSPVDPYSIATDTTSASEIALLKGQIYELKAIITLLGSPAQAGGNVVVTGSLPGFATTPTFNLGALNGVALDATLQSIKSLLGAAPAQVGGKIDTVINGTATDIGTSIAATTATTLVAANASRRGFSFQNQTTGNCWVNTSGTPTGTYHDLLIPTGALYESKDSHVGTGAIQAYCAAAGGIYARQW